jgi:hypothetical protein
MTSPTCSEARGELPALLYGDVDPAERALLEGHVEACASCRAELERLGEARQALDQWTVMDDRADPRALARETARLANHAHAPRRRRRFLLPAVAAAALVFALLAAAGTRVSLADGRASLVLRLPWSAPATSGDPASAEVALRQLVTEEIARLEGRWTALHEERLAELAARLADEHALLVRAIDQVREHDWRRLGELFLAMAQENEQAQAETSEAIFGLASLVATEQPR